MSLPSTFGEFWPDGEYEFDQQTWDSGWGKRIQENYNKKMINSQNNSFQNGNGYRFVGDPYYVSQKFTKEIGTTIGPDYPPIGLIEDCDPPQSFQVIRGKKSLGSIFKMNNGILAVDEILRSIIDEIEPNIHQFFPIEIKWRNNRLELRYIIVIRKYLDSFSPENSKDYSWRIESPKYPNSHIYEENKKSMNGLSFSRKLFGNSHLWRERNFNNPLICISDELKNEIEKLSLRIPKIYKMREV